MGNQAGFDGTLVSIIVPTFKRPKGLDVALRSLTRQSADGVTAEIIVADNDPAGSAERQVHNYAKICEHPVHYVHAPVPGVSNARNAAVAKANGRYLAFLDDDQEAAPYWLSEYMQAATKLKAGLVFGPTFARVSARTAFTSSMERFFSRPGPDLDFGEIDHFYGCGNSLLDRKICRLPDPVFDPALNETGGEDDCLFAYIQHQGVKIAWARKAVAREDILPQRATFEYIAKRAFANGQGPSQACAQDRNWLGVIKWIIIGAAQYLIYWPAWKSALWMNKPSSLRYMIKARAGLGKILWYDRYNPRLYGDGASAQVAENTPAEADRANKEGRTKTALPRSRQKLPS